MVSAIEKIYMITEFTLGNYLIVDVPIPFIMCLFPVNPNFI